MSTHKQKDIFLSSEGNAWFDRNHDCIKAIENWEFDPIVRAVTCFDVFDSAKPKKLLEVGCGNGQRLRWLKQNQSIECYGVDPSTKAIVAAQGLGIDAREGTADCLEFPNEIFDYVCFGFCLYLCDRDDLFRIAMEAHRVLKKQSWLIIHDFYAKVPTKRPYHHKEGIYSFKMDYRKVFDWHPDFTCCYHKVGHHKSLEWTDDTDEWVATSVLRKCSQ